MTRDDIISASKAEGGMFIVIPSVVQLDTELPLSARMLYGIITWKCNSYAFTWATNRELGEELGVSAKRVSALLSLLEARGHIEMEIEYKDGTNEIVRRYIYPIMQSARSLARGTPPPQNKYTLPLGMGIPPPENEEVICNINKKNIKDPPFSPPKGDGAVPDDLTPEAQPAPAPRSRRTRRPKSIPDHCPERFEKFWTVYPRDEDRAKAVQEWDKLLQDKDLLALHGGDETALLDAMSLGLGRHLDCEDWRKGVGIPYAFRWLRDRKWTEKTKLPVARTPPPAEPASDGRQLPVWT